MKKTLPVFLSVMALIFSISRVFGQDRTLDFKQHCSSSTECNPFLKGVACGSSVVRTTHGSPSFNNTTDKQVLLNAWVAGNGTEYGEGFTIEYPFQAGKEYKITVKHQGFLPPTGGAFPILMIALTNDADRYDDECGEGYLRTTNTVIQFEAYVSSTISTATYTFTPNQNIGFLWLRSKPQGSQQTATSVKILSVEFDDKSDNGSTTPNPGGGKYWCDETLDFCSKRDSPNFSYYRVKTPIDLHCDVFDKSGQVRDYPLQMKFAAPEITFSNGFMAHAAPAASGQVRLFVAIATIDPCNQVLSNINSTEPEEYILPLDTKPAIKRTPSATLSVYPSVTSGQVNITGLPSELRGASVIILDQSGRAVYQSRNSAENNPVILNLSHLANGMYFLKLSTSEKSVTQKIIIRK